MPQVRKLTEAQIAQAGFEGRLYDFKRYRALICDLALIPGEGIELGLRPGEQFAHVRRAFRRALREAGLDVQYISVLDGDAGAERIFGLIQQREA